MEHTTIPADIPCTMHEEYVKNYLALTKGTDRLLLFAADHKIEHLDKDFLGPSIASEAHNPEYIFKIAHQGTIGALATQLGLIARYGKKYPHVNYIVKLNSKTNIVGTEHKDPFSRQLWHVEQVITFKQFSGLLIRGIGLTVYLGSEYEDLMLEQAAQAIYKAHQHGLISILWMYPRGKYVQDPKDGALTAGATGVATALGADFTKINVPHPTHEHSRTALLKRAVEAAGTTKVLCAGGQTQPINQLLHDVYEQLTNGGTAGLGIGRNIYQRPFDTAIALTQALSALIYDHVDTTTALHMVKNHLSTQL